MPLTDTISSPGMSILLVASFSCDILVLGEKIININQNHAHYAAPLRRGHTFVLSSELHDMQCVN